MAKSLDQIAEVFRAGGNLEPGYAYDASKDAVRPLTAEEKREAEESVNAESAAAKARQKVRDSIAAETAAAEAATIANANAGQ